MSVHEPKVPGAYDPGAPMPMLQISGGGPNNHMSTILEPCGDTNPLAWLHGSVEVSLFGTTTCTMHVDAIACTVTRDEYGLSTAVAEEPDLQSTLEAYYALNGGESPLLLDHNGRTYCVLLYPYSD